jgi:hypothetical protein
MKLLTTFFIIAFTIIDGIQNAPAIHPIHVHTIPLHPVTHRPIVPSVTPIQPTESSKSWSDSTQVTGLTSSPSSSSSSATDYHSSWWNNQSLAVRIILHIFLQLLVFTLIYKVLDKFCKSKKQVEPSKKECPAVLKNKMYISTIDGRREESPPTYVDIHKV